MKQTKLKIPDTEKIERKCLKCQTKFMAETKYFRLCPPCRKIATESYRLDNHIDGTLQDWLRTNKPVQGL